MKQNIIIMKLLANAGSFLYSGALTAFFITSGQVGLRGEGGFFDLCASTQRLKPYQDSKMIQIQLMKEMDFIRK